MHHNNYGVHMNMHDDRILFWDARGFFFVSSQVTFPLQLFCIFDDSIVRNFIELNESLTA